MVLTACILLGLVPLQVRQGSPLPDSCRVIVLGYSIGEIITPPLADRYNILKGRGEFSRAVVLELPDSSWGIFFTVPGGTGPRDTLIRCTRREILLMAEKVQHYEELKDGSYVMGTTPVRLRFIGKDSSASDLFYPPDAARAAMPVLSWNSRPDLQSDSLAHTLPAGVAHLPADLLPLTHAPDLSMPVRYPYLAFGVGIRTIAPAFSVAPGGARLISAPFFPPTLNVLPELVLTGELGIQVDWGIGWNGCFTTGATVLLYTHPFDDPGIRPFIEAGGVWTYIHTDLDLAGDPAAYLKANNGGVRAGIGIEYSLDSWVDVVADLSYERIAPLTYVLVDNYNWGLLPVPGPMVTPVSVDLSGMRYGFRLKFH